MRADRIGPAPTTRGGGSRWRARLLTVVLPLLLGIALALPHLFDGNLQHQALALLRAARGHGEAGVALVFLAQLVIAASGVLPASLLGIAAGALYGIAAGFAVAAAGTLAGALLAFALARSLLRPFVARLLAHRPRLHRMDAVLAGDGWKLVFLLRVSPVMPFAITSYALGLSAVRFRAYLLGTIASLLPLLAFVAMGRMVGVGATQLRAGNPAQWLGLAIGAGATLGLAWYLMRLLRRACVLSSSSSS